MIGQVQCRNCNFYQVQAKNIRIHTVTGKQVPHFGGVVLNCFGNIFLGFIAFVVIGFIIAGLVQTLLGLPQLGGKLAILLAVAILILIPVRSFKTFRDWQQSKPAIQFHCSHCGFIWVVL